MDARMQPRPPIHKPGVGRTWCRIYSTPGAAREYEQGWLNPEAYKPAASGTPAQQGALDRLMERPE